jgi:hypothetical protein
MVNEIKSNVKHYINIFEDIVDENIPPRSVYINPEEVSAELIRCLNIE